MKRYKFTYILLFTLLFTGCSLEEEPPFLSRENVYSSADNARAALDGIYTGLTGYGYFGNNYLYLLHINSGLGVTKKGGNKNTSADNVTSSSLKPSNNNKALNNLWGEIYTVIARANDAIYSVPVVDDPQTDEELNLNDVAGQAYFIRAFCYFNLVRLWGEVPLRLDPTNKENFFSAKSLEKDIYEQVIADAKLAAGLMNGAGGVGYAKPNAANMLLAKVYMTLATAPIELQDAGVDYWQMAYDEAIKVYGQYSLVGEYAALFNEATSDNTEESIFEVQSSEEASMDFVRAFTTSNFTKANTFGLLRVNVEVYDAHAETYPGDERISTTYLGSFMNQKNGKLFKNYPDLAARKNFGNGFPYLYKLGSKNPANVVRTQNQNFAIYRYSDLLLMLAEISNELQNGEQLGYVTEVLDRVGLIPHAGYNGTQDDFMQAIMKEYQFELLGEGHGWYNNRRRGYDYFLQNVINHHNNYPKFKANVDVTHETDESIVMKLPIPATEINTNEEISE